MREANAAWHVLRDPGRRLAHDRELGIDHRPWVDEPGAAADPPPPPDPPDAVAPSGIGDLLVLVPAALLTLAVVCFAVGTLMLNTPLFVGALGLLALSAITFMITPFVTLARDRRRGRRVGR